MENCNCETSSKENWLGVNLLKFPSSEQRTIHLHSELFPHCEQNAPLPKFQSGFRIFYSSETALPKVQGDIVMSMDHQEVTLLVLLDLTTAFDTIDHEILLDVLENNSESSALPMIGLPHIYLIECNAFI